MLNWDDLRFLLAIRESGSASSAARKLGVDKATVARRVTGLEQALGVRLLVRRSSGWGPTPAGERVASAARDIERQLVTLKSDFSSRTGAPRTTVSVTAPHWFCAELLLPALPQLVAEAPWLDLTIVATSRVLSLPQREADVALRNSRPEHGDFVVRRAGELGSTMFASRAYAKRNPVPRSQEEWGRHRLIGYHDRVTYVASFRWLEDLVGTAPGITRVDDAKALCETIKSGLGIGVIPCVLGDAERELVRYGDELHREPIWLVSPAELAGTRGVKLTLAFVSDLFKRHARALAG